jgi:hypothetical protein
VETFGGLIGIALIVMALGITISAIFKEFFRHRERRLEIQAAATAEKAAQYAAQTERLEQRMRVMERIVTDKGIVVADEIEKLRHEPLN